MITVAHGLLDTSDTTSEKINFIILIPARLAATRLPNKPLIDLGGKPMIVRVAERAMQAGARQVIVATPDDAICDVCEHHNIAAQLTRADHLSGTDRIAEVAATLALPDDTVIVNLQGDEPLINPRLITTIAQKVTRHIPMATVACPLMPEQATQPQHVKVVCNQANHALYFSRALIPSKKEGPFLRHIGLYAYRADFLQCYAHLPISPLEQSESLEQLRVLWHGFPIAVHITKASPTGVDTPEDLHHIRPFFEYYVDF